MVQRLGWVQVAECAQGDIFDSIDELLVGLRHGESLRVKRLLDPRVRKWWWVKG